MSQAENYEKEYYKIFNYDLRCFFVLFICTGIVNTFITKNPIVMQIMTTICSWTSFYVLMFLFFICVFAVSQYKGTTILSLLSFSPKALAVGFVVQLIGGPLSEEPAYRGFALPAMTKYHGVIKAGLINGVVW